MKLIVQLMTVIIVVFLFPPASEGVHCYYCYKGLIGDDRSGNSTHFNESAVDSDAKQSETPYDSTCESSHPTKTTKCGRSGCQKAIGYGGGDKAIIRGCRDPSRPDSGCESLMEDIYSYDVCYCSTDYCNRSYALTYKWTLLTVGFVATISASHSVLQFNHY